MKSLLLLASLLPAAFAQAPKPATKLNPNDPIYLGDVFWPPTMTFMAWLPSEQNKPNEWCYRATDASNHMLFSLGGIDALQIHDYFDDEAYLTREGKRFANCRVTPESGRMGACEGVLDHDCEGGQKFTGPGTRRWSCWVIESERANLTAPSEEKVEDGVTSKDPVASATSAMLGSSVQAAFTPGATGGR